MEYLIDAKPTVYSGVQFRSRLEARWAAFYDSFGLKWIYEPIDFGGWSPDFLLHNGKYKDFVEVKPITEIDIPTSNKMIRHCGGSGMLLCGLTPDYCWLNTKGWWERYAFGYSESNWKSAGNSVQWNHS